MKADIDKLSEELASDSSVTDYDFWKAIRTLNDRIFVLDRSRSPIPIQFLRLRAVLRKARAKRRGDRASAR